MGGGFGPCLFTITSNRIIMATATSIAQEFRPLFIGGDPYTYASVGAAEAITLPMSTSFFYLSNEVKPAVGTPGGEDYVAAVSGDLTVSIPNAKHLGTMLILSVSLGASSVGSNAVILQFTGINGELDSIEFDAGSYDPYFFSILWTGSHWQFFNKPIIH